MSCFDGQTRTHTAVSAPPLTRNPKTGSRLASFFWRSEKGVGIFQFISIGRLAPIWPRTSIHFVLCFKTSTSTFLEVYFLMSGPILLYCITISMLIHRRILSKPRRCYNRGMTLGSCRRTTAVLGVRSDVLAHPLLYRRLRTAEAVQQIIPTAEPPTADHRRDLCSLPSSSRPTSWSCK